MKKLLFTLAIASFLLGACKNQSKSAAEKKDCCSATKTETSVDLKKSCTDSCSNTCTEKSTEVKSCCEKKTDSTAVAAKTECSAACKK